MTKKQDFLRAQQSRDKHPELGSGKNTRGHAKGQADMNPADKQAAHTGKVANDHNKQGHQAPTQKNEGRRTPESRHDRLVFAGGPQNIIEARTGGKGGGRGPRGAG
jgi:hypothetical protein